MRVYVPTRQYPLSRALCMLAHCGLLGVQGYLKYFGVPADLVDMWMQPVSFSFLAILVVMSVRGFLLTVSQVRHDPRNCPSPAARGYVCDEVITLPGAQMFDSWSQGVSSITPVLLLAQVMGSHFVATVMTMRMNMPEVYRCVRACA